MHNLIPNSNPALFVKLLCCGQFNALSFICSTKENYYEELRAKAAGGGIQSQSQFSLPIPVCSSSRTKCWESCSIRDWMMKIGREEQKQKQPPHRDKFIMDGHAHFTEASSEGRNGRRRQKCAIRDARC
jgi:hypothetical protein